MDKRLERILPRVQKPARYVGGEYNAVKKDPAQVDTRIAFCFPDTYEIGMSNLGMRILYGVMNNMDGVWCQRVFAPWGDMEEEMRRAGMPLFALESGEPITDFDIVAFSVGYEMAFPAILNMLDLAGIPLHSAERTELTPLVIAGGTAMYNAEPIADFIDLVSLGEGEDITVELVELHRQARREGWTKREFLRRAAQLDGIVGDETVAALDQLDGGLAFADAGIAQNKDAFAVDFHQHAVAGDAGSQLFIQRGDEHAHQGGGHLGRHQNRHTVLFAVLHHLRQRLHAAAQHHSRRLKGEKLFQMGFAQGGGQFIQIGHLGQTDDLDALAVKIFIVTGQQDARAVHLRCRDLNLFQLTGGVGDCQVGFLSQLCQGNRELRHSGTPLFF